jgi:maltose alpha-D-glucosyltransferase/alpha-amylase
VELEACFVLDPGAPHVLAVARLQLDDRSSQRYSFALTGRPLRVAEAGDGTWRALLAAMVEGKVLPALAGTGSPTGPQPGPVGAALVCRPVAAIERLLADAPGGLGGGALLPERSLGADQSNTSTVIGERILVKAYRRLETGLNPELELLAFLAEEAGFGAVAPLAGYAEMVSAIDGTSTVAIAQAFVADGADAYESIAETLAGWLLAPGEVSVEFATEVAVDLGELTAGLHAALGDARGLPEFEPRSATRDELRGWGQAARRQLVRAVDITPGEAGRVLRELAAAAAAELTVFEALATMPLLSRVHGDFHLGQVLVTPDGYRIIDFEGEPLRPIDERRAHRSPLRDVASMLRSLDHVGRSAGRRAVARHGGRLASPGLDLDRWLRRSRERFLEAYRAGLRRAGSPIVLDPELIRAFEIEKECYEFIYASTYLPSWLWAPTEGLKGLLEAAARPR